MSDQRQEKQQFLVTQILNQGYDGSKFQEFLEKENSEAGTDIDMWSFEDLKAEVKKFIQTMNIIGETSNQHQKTEIQPKNESSIQNQVQQQSTVVQQQQFKDQQKQPSEKQEEEDKSQNDPSKQGFVISKSSDQPKIVLTDPNQKLNGCQINGIYNCQKYTANQIVDFYNANPNSTLNIIVPEYKIIDEGLFKQKYVSFTVQTTQFSWEVNRRFNDFLWLKTMLQKQFPGHYLPNVSKKKAYRSFDELYLTKRRKTLEKFLQYVTKDQLLRSSLVFQDFIAVSDMNLYRQKQKELESKIAQPVKASDFITLDGQIQLEISNKLKTYSRNINQCVNSIDIVYDRLKKSSKVLTTEFDQLSKMMLAAGQGYENLEKIMQQFNEIQPLPETKHSEKIYCIIKLLFATWSQSFEDQKKLIQEYVVDFLRFQKKSHNALKDYVKSRNQLELSYEESQRKLDEKKDRLFALNDIGKWELQPGIEKTIQELQQNKQEAFKYMLYQESCQVKKINIQFGAQNQIFFDDTKQLFKFKFKDYINNFFSLSQLICQNYKSFHNQMSNIAQQLVHVMSDDLKGKIDEEESKQDNPPQENQPKNQSQQQQDNSQNGQNQEQEQAQLQKKKDQKKVQDKKEEQYVPSYLKYLQEQNQKSKDDDD